MASGSSSSGSKAVAKGEKKKRKARKRKCKEAQDEYVRAQEKSLIKMEESSHKKKRGEGKGTVADIEDGSDSDADDVRFGPLGMGIRHWGSPEHGDSDEDPDEQPLIPSVLGLLGAKGNGKAKGKDNGKAKGKANRERQMANGAATANAAKAKGKGAAKTKPKAKARRQRPGQADATPVDADAVNAPAVDADAVGAHPLPACYPVNAPAVEVAPAMGAGAPSGAGASTGARGDEGILVVEEAPVHCYFCGESSPVVESQLVSKLRGEWACRKCASSRTILYRSGEMPNNNFEMSEADRHSFWLSCQNLKGEQKADMARMLKRKLTKGDQDTYAEGGEYLPLGVWRAKGFDADRIAEKTDANNKLEDPVLGLCYRVVITSKVFKKTTDTVTIDESLYQPGAAGAVCSWPTSSGSSSSINNDDPAVLSAMIAKQTERVKELQEQEKAAKARRKKLCQPLAKEIQNVSKLAGTLKVDKIPQCFMGEANPLGPARKDLEDLLAEVDGCEMPGLDAMAAKIATVIERAKLVQRAMKPFA